MKKDFQKVAPQRLGDIFIPRTIHRQPQSEGFLSNFTLRFLFNNILAHIGLPVTYSSWIKMAASKDQSQVEKGASALHEAGLK
jgi:hypothetical protein